MDGTAIDLSAGLVRKGRDEVSIEDLSAVLSIFKELSEPAQARLIETVGTFFNLAQKKEAPSAFHSGIANAADHAFTVTSGRSFSDSVPMSPKEFMLQKQPRTAVERVACLGYYLTHYRETPHFKTLDISKLNTEAAQSKFSNAAMSVNDALRSGYLISVAKGNKQLSAIGELFVQALPEREAAKMAMASKSTKRKRHTPRPLIDRKASAQAHASGD